MQPNVQRALYSEPGKPSLDTITCECGEALVFGTDEIGRTTQSCPTGRCFRGKQLVLPSPEAFRVRPRNKRHGSDRRPRRS